MKQAFFIIFIVATAMLVGFLIIRNRKDRKNLERDIMNEEMSPEKHFTKTSEDEMD